jgi:Flp pilus assembly protein TadD
VVQALRGPDKTGDAKLHYQVVMVAMGKSDFAVADEELRKALALTPQNPLFLYNLALVQSKAERPVAAMKSLHKATELGLPEDQQ